MSAGASAIIDASARALAQWIVERQTALAPILEHRYESAGQGEWFNDWATDTRGRLMALAECIAFDSVVLFESEIAWAKTAFEARGVGLGDISANLIAMRDVLRERMPARETATIDRFMGAALRVLEMPGTPPECLLGPGGAYAATPHATLAKQYLLDLLEGDRDRASERIIGAVKGGVAVDEVYRWVLEPAMIEIGRLWMIGDVSVADEHYATAATEMVMSRLHQIITRRPSNGRVLVAGAVGGDLHAIGIRMVSDLFEIAGWRSHYLGANSPGFAMTESVERVKPDLVAVSAKLTHHVRTCAGVIADIRAGEHGRRIPIIVGGMPFATDPTLYRKVGADAASPTAWDAVRLGESLLPR